MSDTLFLRYIGRKPRCTDLVTNSGVVWNGRGDIKPVPRSVGMRLLSFPGNWEDVTKHVEANETPPPLPKLARLTPRVTEGSDRDLEIRRAVDIINGMTEDERDQYFPRTPEEDPDQAVFEATGAVPTFAADREVAIRQAIRHLAMLPDGERELHFGASTGKPHVASLESLLGYDITGQERDAMWDEYIVDEEATMGQFQRGG